MGTTDFQFDTETKLKRIARLSASDPKKSFNNIIHHINKEPLTECYHLLNGKKAIGIDGITKEEYGKCLNANLENLIARMKRMSYRPSPVRRVEIPKMGQAGKYRSLGISNFEDKLLQKQFQRILASLYEPIFLPCSYGFRQGIGCHDAIRTLQNYLSREQVSTVIDIDLAQFFDTYCS